MNNDLENLRAKERTAIAAVCVSIVLFLLGGAWLGDLQEQKAQEAREAAARAECKGRGGFVKVIRSTYRSDHTYLCIEDGRILK